MENNKWIKSVALLMAVVLLVSVGFFANSKALKAEEDGEAYTAPETVPEEKVTEIVIDTSDESENAAPADAPEEAETQEDAAPAEETAPEEDAEEAEAEEDAAPAEDAEEAEANEEEEETERSISVFFQFEGTPKLGDTMTVASTVKGYGDGATYQWQRSTDLVNWVDEPGANGPTYSYVLDRTTCLYHWRLIVTE